MKKIYKLIALSFFLTLGFITISARNKALAGNTAAYMNFDFAYQGIFLNDVDGRVYHKVAVNIDADGGGEKIKYMHVTGKSQGNPSAYIMTPSDKLYSYHKVEKLSQYVKHTLNGSGDHDNKDVVRFAIPVG